MKGAYKAKKYILLFIRPTDVGARRGTQRRCHTGLAMLAAVRSAGT